MRPKTPRRTASRPATLLFSALFALSRRRRSLFLTDPLGATLHSTWVVLMVWGTGAA